MTTRRNFLTGLLAAGAAALIPVTWTRKPKGFYSSATKDGRKYDACFVDGRKLPDAFECHTGEGWARRYCRVTNNGTFVQLGRETVFGRVQLREIGTGRMVS